MAISILDGANEHNIDSIYTFITQRVKLGFTFDAAPEVNHCAVSLVKHSKELSFGTLGTKHKMIIGENYDALKNLLVTHREGIDVIYIDPPYNTEASKADGNDHKSEEITASKFVYRDKFTRNGWLNMMQERLKLARQLLSESGVIFISIDDNEQAYLKVLCDEIFGEENFVTTIPRLTSPQRSGQEKYMNISHDYILCYTYLEDFKNIIHRVPQKEILRDKNGLYIKGDTKAILAAKSQGYSSGGDYDFKYNGKIYQPISKDGKRNRWLWTKERMEAAVQLGILVETKNTLRMQLYLDKKFEERTNTMVGKDDKLTFHTADFMNNNQYSNPSGEGSLTDILPNNDFSYPKSVALIKDLISLSPTNSTILDFFAGSGTTGQAVMELNEEDGGNRQCILVTNNENGIAKNITRERLYRVCNGVGTNGETFKWQYSKEKSYLENNIWDIFEIETHELKIDDFEKAKTLLVDAETQFRLLNENYESKNLDIYNQLASLNPYKK